MTEEQEIQRGVIRAYQNLLSNPSGWRPSSNGLDFDRIGVEEAATLEEVFFVEDDLRDYRPLSLLRGLHKLLAKVLANRLKKIVGKVVSSS